MISVPDLEKQSKTDPKEALTVKVKESKSNRPDAFNSTTQEVLFVLTVTMAIAMDSFFTGSMTVIFTSIGRALNMTTAEITWINASASLTSGSFLFFFGRIADMFGRKSLFIGSLACFSIITLGAGFSRNAITVDVLSAMLGLAAAASVPPAQGMLGVIYEKPSKRKNLAFACFSAGNPLGFVSGSVFSGVAAHVFNWRASFFLLSIIFALFTVIAVFVVPSDHADKEPLSVEALKKFDMVGTALTIAGVSTFSSSLSIGGDAPDGWRTPYVLVLLFVGFISMVVFVFWEKWYTHPLIPMGIWKNPNFSLLIIILTLGCIAFSSMSLWTSLYLQEIKKLQPLEVAVHFLPMAISGLMVNTVAGFTMHKVSNKLLMAIGTLAYSTAFLLLAVNKSSHSYWSNIFPALVLVVIGADFEFCVVNMYVLSSLPQSQQSIAGSIIQTVSCLSVAIGYGISTAIFNAISASPTKKGYYANDPAQPFAAAFWMSFGFGVAGAIMVPFLTISTQGHYKGHHKGDEITAAAIKSPAVVTAGVRATEVGQSVELQTIQDK